MRVPEKINFVDVGSFGGLSSPWHEKYIDTIIKVDPFEQGSVGDKETIYQACLSDYDGSTKFYVFNKQDCSSMLLPIRKMSSKRKFAVHKTYDIKCYTLDSILDNHGVLFDFLKLDTQGSELRILHGGQRHLRDFTGLHLESNTEKVYRKSNNLKQIRKFLYNFSFVLVGQVTKSKRHGDYLFISTKPERQRKANGILQLYRNKITVGQVIEFYEKVFLAGDEPDIASSDSQNEGCNNCEDT